jgi:hypothetical protein
MGVSSHSGRGTMQPSGSTVAMSLDPDRDVDRPAARTGQVGSGQIERAHEEVAGARVPKVSPLKCALEVDPSAEGGCWARDRGRTEHQQARAGAWPAWLWALATVIHRAGTA